MKRLLALFNPRAHSGSDPEAGPTFERKLRDAGFDVVLHRLDTPADLDATVAKEAATCDAIVVGGGDGTIRSALPAILKAGLPLGVWPLGTANDFAGSIGIESADDCVASLAAWNEQRIDVAEVNGHYFINNVTLGLPAEAAVRLTPELKKRFGVFATLAVLPALLRNARPFRAEIEADGHTQRRTIVAALIGNGAYQGGFPIRYVGLADGNLHVAVCRTQSRWALFPILFDVATKRMATSRRIETFSAKCVSIRTARPARIAADGDIVAVTPASITLHPAALRIFKMTEAIR